MRSYEYTYKLVEKHLKNKKSSNVLFIGLDCDAKYVISKVGQNCECISGTVNRAFAHVVSLRKNTYKITNILSRFGTGELFTNSQEIHDFIGSIDLTIAVRVLEHLTISEIETCLWEVYKLLVGDGIFVVTVPDLNSIISNMSSNVFGSINETVSELFAPECKYSPHKTILTQKQWQVLLQSNRCFKCTSDRQVVIDARPFYSEFVLELAEQNM